MSVFTMPLCNGESMILFVNMWSITVALVFVTLVGLFMAGKILFWKARLKKSLTIVFRESKKFILKSSAKNICFSCPLNLLTRIFILSENTCELSLSEVCK